MKKNKFHYAISGYRWAPESFQASKGLVGQPKKVIPMSHEERHEVGMLFLSKGYGAAVGYVKHIERMRERQCKTMITYGFRLKEMSTQFAYCPQLYCRADAPISERLWLFKKIRSVLMETEGRVVTSTECDLDGEFNPVNVREHTATADFGRPLRIYMGKQIVRGAPEPEYRPWTEAPEKARTANARTRPKRRR